MLLNVHVKNLALIKEADIYFDKGLNILTGETGAGKSIIIGSINMALGGKVSKEMLKGDEEYSLAEAVFQVEQADVLERLNELDVVVSEDHQVIISRKIINGRSTIKVNGETMAVGALKNVTGLLIDIHGQHDHQSLLYKQNHLHILDELLDSKAKAIKEEIRCQYKEYKRLNQELSLFTMDEQQRQRELSFCQFELEEIDEVQLSVGEDEELEEIYKKLSNSRKIVEELSGIYHEITGDSAHSISSSVSRFAKTVDTLKGFDHNLEDMYHQLLDIESICKDIAKEMSSYIDDASFDEEKVFEIESRLDIINKLKAKYGKSIQDILEYRDQKKQEIEKFQNYEESRKKVSGSIAQVSEKLCILSKKLTAHRKSAAKELESKIKNVLLDLNFSYVDFKAAFETLPEFGENGYDATEFLISTNPGEPIKPLSKIASGGELSRIMLGLKTILASKDQVESLIFDEIDTGISGRAAQRVSEKLGAIALERQVICITHLPQIAAMADRHFLIEKKVEDEKTITDIRALNDNDSIDELARMLGGVEITENVRKNAKEMKYLAKRTKKN